MEQNFTGMESLKTALMLNAVFSLVTGIILVFGSGPISQIFSVSQDRPFFFLGFGLILFASTVFYVGRQKPIEIFQAYIISAQDFIWVLASILLLIIDPFQFSKAGNVIIAVVALIVLAFALMQVSAITKVNRNLNRSAETQKMV